MRRLSSSALAAALALASLQTAFADEAMLELATTSGCFLCHSISQDPEVSVPLGPSYKEIAARYRDDPEAVSYLFDRVKHGSLAGPQNWSGKVNMRFMPPSVALSDEHNRMLVDWILTLDDDQGKYPQLITFESMLNLASTSGCLACHRINRASDDQIRLAPSLREVSARYADQPGSTQKLIDSVRNGTLNRPAGWEDVNMRFMPPSVALSAESAQDLVAWILSLEPPAP